MGTHIARSHQPSEASAVYTPRSAISKSNAKHCARARKRFMSATRQRVSNQAAISSIRKSSIRKIEHRTRNIEQEASNKKHRTRSIEQEASNKKHRTRSIEQEASNKKHRTRSIEQEASNKKHRTIRSNIATERSQSRKSIPLASVLTPKGKRAGRAGASRRRRQLQVGQKITASGSRDLPGTGTAAAESRGVPVDQRCCRATPVDQRCCRATPVDQRCCRAPPVDQRCCRAPPAMDTPIPCHAFGPERCCAQIAAGGE